LRRKLLISESSRQLVVSMSSQLDKYVEKSSLKHIQRGCSGLLVCQGIVGTAGLVERAEDLTCQLHRLCRTNILS